MQDVVVPRPPDRREMDSHEDEIDLMEYALVLWRRRWLIVVISLTLAVAGFVATSLSSPIYEASVRLVVSAPKTGQANEAAPAVSVASFKALVENQSLAAKVIQEFNLSAAPNYLTPERLLAKVLTVATIRDTNVVVLTIRLPDAKLATNVANRLAKLAVDLALELSQDETVRARDFIKAQLDQSKTRFDEAQIRLETFKKSAQVELLRKDADVLLEKRGELLNLLVDIATEKARLARAEEELGKQQEVRPTKRAVDIQPNFPTGAQPGSNAQFRGEVLDPYVNPVYEILQEQVTTSRTRLAGLERRRSELVGDLKLGAPQLAKLSELYAKQAELSRLETDHELAKKVYVDVATRYEEARLQVTARSAQLQVIDRALVPDRPVSRHRVRNAVIAMVVGLMLSAIAILFLDALGAAAARARAAERPAVR